jgi:hypothetical protein
MATDALGVADWPALHAEDAAVNVAGLQIDDGMELILRVN